ncbi:hypothetical protein L7F22_069176 [Adiantum nelumboides]|nr:hypothetical protein [Adiantum nelumboides]
MGVAAQRPHRGAADRHPAVRRAGVGDPRGPRLPRPDPVRHRPRRALLQLLDRRGAPARPVAAHHPGVLPERRHRVGGAARRRRAQRGRGRELGLARCPVPAPGPRPRAGRPVPRWRRRRRHARVRPPDPQLRRRRVLPARGEGRDELDRPRHTVYLSTDLGPGTMTTSGYPRTVRRLRRGEALESAELVYAGEETDLSISAFRDHTPGFERDFLRRALAFYADELHLIGADGTLTKIDVPDSAMTDVHREWCTVELREDWGSFTAGSLLAARFDDVLAGTPSWEVLFEPTDSSSLAGYAWTRHHLVLDVLEHVVDRLVVLTPGEQGWTRAPFTGAPEFGSVTVAAVDADEGDDVWLIVTDYLTPSTLSIATVGEQPRPLRSAPAFFDASRHVIEQHFVTSDDGNRVPYFLVRRNDLPFDGSAPTLLYGYGGFEIPMTPGYSGGTGRSWLERGGVYAVANLRGGGHGRRRPGPDRPRRHLARTPRRAGRQQRRPDGREHAGPLPGAVRRGGHPGAAAGHEALQPPARRRLLDGRVRRPGHRRLGVHPDVLAVPPDRRRGRLPADDPADLHPRRPGAPRPRPQVRRRAGGRRSRRDLLREHRRRARRRRGQRAGRQDGRTGLRIPVGEAGMSDVVIRVRGEHERQVPAERGTALVVVEAQGPEAAPVRAEVERGTAALVADVRGLHDPDAGPVRRYVVDQARSWVEQPPSRGARSRRCTTRRCRCRWSSTTSPGSARGCPVWTGSPVRRSRGSPGTWPRPPPRGRARGPAGRAAPGRRTRPGLRRRPGPGHRRPALGRRHRDARRPGGRDERPGRRRARQLGRRVRRRRLGTLLAPDDITVRAEVEAEFVVRPGC